ncbi:LuxR C-terminal-related transcriptional regulator [Nonomuraea insulae]|uniref:LuxR C-terminal-related transcriptional regulator n=1 Tax=Nonomuraea insulae TaxID=1616787 RepID=A0ABW1CF42_9ACTN
MVAAFAESAVKAVVVRSAAGYGKTRLAREALRRLGCRVEWITATRAATAIPFAPVAHLLPGDFAPFHEPVGFVKAIGAQVASWGGRAKVALGVDDAHLLDDASSTVIAHLISTGAAFVVLTVRGGEPLADCLARLGKDGEAVVVELPALPGPAIDRLIDHSTGGEIDAVRRLRLHTSAKGNPLALRELLHGTVPGGLTDLVASRLNGLDRATRGVVELVACGEPVPLAFLERLAGADAVAAAEDSGLVVGERDGERTQARLEHPLYGEVLRARMPLGRARQVYRDLAGQLLATGMRRRDDGLRAALWQVEGGQITRPATVREGAEQAIGREGLALAERLARAAREAGPGLEADRLLAEILQYQGRGEEAAALLPAVPPREPAERLSWAVTRADLLYWNHGDLTAAQRVLDLGAGHAVTEGARAFMLFFAGRCEEAVRAAHAVLGHDGHDPQPVVWAAAAATAALGFLGRLDEAQAVRQRGAAVAAAHVDTLPWGVFQIEIGACLAHLAAGRPAAAASIASAGYRAAAETGVTMMVSAWALHAGIAAAARGHLDDADRLLGEARAGFDHTDTFRLRRCCLAAHAWVRALRGRPAEARDLMARADRLDNGTNGVFAPWIVAWLGWVAQADGDGAAAIRHAESAATLAAASNMPNVAAMARYDVVRLGGAVGSLTGGADLGHLPAVTGDLPAGLGDLPAVLGATAKALGDTDAPALTRAAETLADLGHDLLAAEVATVAARALRRTGHRGRAAVAAGMAATLRARCPAAHTPLLAHDDLGACLSPREHQIALLAAHHSSKQIAQRLRIAVPTVNNTLARAYAKLGVTGRAQLRELLEGGCSSL